MPETWKVGVIVHEAEFSELYKYAVGAWLTHGADAIPLPGGMVSGGLTALYKKIFNGIEIPGSLTIADDAIEIRTKPNWAVRLMVKGDLDVQFRIPIRDIVAVTGPKSLAFGLITGLYAMQKVAIATASTKIYVTAQLRGPALTRRLGALAPPS